MKRKRGLCRRQDRRSSSDRRINSGIKQALERIIGERPVANADKILSLYESDLHVIVRCKAGADVEFGNTLFLAETSSS